MRTLRTLACCTAIALTSPSLFSADPAFRTDGGDEKLPWYALKPAEFPPEGSAHHIGGELISLDHIDRTGSLRRDRDDTIRRGEWDHALPFTLLACGSIAYHGAPAELRDIPIGTHLHGEFYLEEAPAIPAGKKPSTVLRTGPFTQVIRLEDDFSYDARRHRTWRVDAIDLEKGTLTVTGIGPAANQTDTKPTIFQIGPATRIWKGHAIGSLADLAASQSLLLNITAATLKGPGRCIDIWIDPESREVAAGQQIEVHRQFERAHGLAGRVEEVDNQQGIVTVTLFAGFDVKLLEDFAVNESLSAAVSEESLRTYDQGSDRMRGDILEIQKKPAGPGDSGIRVRFKPVTLLEGYRPKRIIRIFSGKWKVDDIPREERLYQ